MKQSNKDSATPAITKVSFAALASLTGSILGAFLGSFSLADNAGLESGATIALYSFGGMFIGIAVAVLLRNVFSKKQLYVLNGAMVLLLLAFTVWLFLNIPQK